MLWCKNCFFQQLKYSNLVQQVQLCRVNYNKKSVHVRCFSLSSCGIYAQYQSNYFRNTLKSSSRSSPHLVIRRNNFISRRNHGLLFLPNSLKSCNLLQSTKDFISFPGGGAIKKKEFVERRIMGFSAEQMFDVVSDVQNYIHFLPWCESSNVKSRSSSQIVADLVIGMKPVTESYTSVVSFRRPYFIRAESKEGGKHFTHMTTNWKFSPGLKGNPQSCLIDFYVSFEFRSSFHSQLANIFFNEVVKAMANAFYVEAKRRYGQESMPSKRVALIPSAAKSKSDDDNLP